MRIEFSPKYKAEMEKREHERKKKADAIAEKIAALKLDGIGIGWTAMEKLPFKCFDIFEGGIHDNLLITDGKTVTVAEVRKRFGTPIFYKKEPEMIFRDGMMFSEGGEIDPREDLPKWWWKWEFRDLLAPDEYAYGEPREPEVDFVATHWMFLPTPPAP